MTKLGTVFVELDLDSSKYERNQLRILDSAKTSSLSMEKNFQNLGVTSDKMFNAMRQSAENSYTALTNRANLSAREIEAIEKAKNAKIQALNEQQHGKSMWNLDQLKSSYMTLFATVTAGAYTLAKSIESSLKMEAISVSMKAVTGDAALAGKEIQFIREESARLGLVFASTTTEFIKFSASAKNTSIEGEQTRRIFSAISETVTALKLNEMDAQLIFMGFTQMISKQKVSMEELRRQVGERLPGALKMAAEAMGWSTQELIKNVEAGKVMATDLLPKLADQMHKTYGEAAKEAAQTGQAAINRFNNALFDTKAALGTALMPTLTSLLENFFKPLLGYVQMFIGGLEIMAVKIAALPDKASAAWEVIKSGKGLASKEGQAMYKSLIANSNIQQDLTIADIMKKYDGGISTKSTAELAAENARIAEAKRKESQVVDEKAKELAEKMAKAQADWAEKIDLLNPKLDQQDKTIIKLWNDAEALRKTYGDKSWISEGLYRGLTFESDKQVEVNLKKIHDLEKANADKIAKLKEEAEKRVSKSYQDEINKIKQADQDRIKNYQIAMKGYEDEINKVNVMESDYSLTVEQAATKRMELIRLQIIEQERLFNSIKGHSEEERLLQAKTREDITKSNEAYREQQRILEDRTAWGGYNKAIHSIADEYNNVGKNIEGATRSIFGSIESGIDSFLDKTSDGFMKWGKLVTGIMNSIMQQMIQTGITKPIMGAIAGVMTPGTAAAGTGGLASAGMGILQGAGYMAGPALGAATGNNTATIGGLVGTGIGTAMGFGVGGSTALAAVGTLAPGIASFLATSALAVPIIGVIGAGIGLLVSKLFSDDEKGYAMLGLKFTGKKFETLQEGSVEMPSSVASGFTKYRKSVMNALEDLNFDISGFSKKWTQKLSMVREDGSNAAEAIRNYFSAYIKFATDINFKPFAIGKEKYEETVNRVIVSFGVLNNMLKLLDVNIIKSTSAGVKMSQTLIKLMGGIDAATSKMDFFFKNFYSAEEQSRRLVKSSNESVAETFKELGMSVPKTREEFTALVESINLTLRTAAHGDTPMREKGLEQFAALMNIAGSLDVIFDAQEQQAIATADAVRAQVDIINGYIQSFLTLRGNITQYQIDRQRKSWGLSDYKSYYGQLQGQMAGLDSSAPDYYAKSLDIQTRMFETLKTMEGLANEQISQTEQTISSLTALSRSIESTIRGLYTSDLAPVQSSEYVQSQYNLLKSRSRSGAQEDIQAFMDYTQDYLKFFKTFSGQEDYKSIFASVVTDMSDTKTIVDNAMDTAQDTLDTLNAYLIDTGTSVDTFNGKLNELAGAVDSTIAKLNSAIITATESNGQITVKVVIDGKEIGNAVATQITTGNEQLTGALQQVGN